MFRSVSALLLLAQVQLHIGADAAEVPGDTTAMPIRCSGKRLKCTLENIPKMILISLYGSPTHAPSNKC